MMDNNLLLYVTEEKKKQPLKWNGKFSMNTNRSLTIVACRNKKTNSFSINIYRTLGSDSAEETTKLSVYTEIKLWISLSWCFFVLCPVMSTYVWIYSMYMSLCVYVWGYVYRCMYVSNVSNMHIWKKHGVTGFGFPWNGVLNIQTYQVGIIIIILVY